MNDPEKLLNFEEQFDESDNDIQTFNDLLRLFDYWISLPLPITRNHAVNIGRQIFLLSTPAQLLSTIIITDLHKKGLAHGRAVITVAPNIMERLMDTIRGDAGTEEEYKLLNDWLNCNGSSEYRDFLKNRTELQYMEIV